jgi:hypothetical protein
MDKKNAPFPRGVDADNSNALQSGKRNQGKATMRGTGNSGLEGDEKNGFF